MSSENQSTIDITRQPHLMGAAPEGLLDFERLLVKSREIGEQLRQSTKVANEDSASFCDDLRALTLTWEHMEGDIARVGPLVKVYGKPEIWQLRNCFDLRVFESIFFYDGREDTTGQATDLRPKWKAVVTQLRHSNALLAKFEEFPILWLTARAEVLDKGLNISNRYQVFTRGNLLYRDRRDFFPEEPFRYGERPFPVDDARTIVSVLSNLNSVKDSYELGSVDNLARLVSERASIGLDDGSHGLASPAASHTGTMKVDAPTVETSWEPELDILDPSLLRRHIVPRLGGKKVQERLGKVLGKRSMFSLRKRVIR